MAAADIDIDNNALTDFKALRASTIVMNPANEFVPRNERQFISGIMTVENMHIGAANTDTLDFDKHLIRFWLRYWAALQFKALGSDKNGRAHFLYHRYFTMRSLARSIVKAIAAMRIRPKNICCCVASISR